MRIARPLLARSWSWQEVNNVWRQTLQDEHLRTIGRWESLPDKEVAFHLCNVAKLDPWWRTLSIACPLVASPVAERSICEIRRHLVRLLAEQPTALPSEAETVLLLLAGALSRQATQSEHAYVVSAEEQKWACQLSEDPPTRFADVVKALLPSCQPYELAARPEAEGNQTSVVQSFYERHPIPQWVDLMPWERPDLLPRPVQEAGSKGKLVLVAGCGTARWACQFATTFPAAQVMGVDISQASLAYASKRREEVGLTNISFHQADLRAWSPQQRFDLIECGGVLHHLEDPFAAWKNLSSLLQPGGSMLVSLYSRLARKPLKNLRRSIVPGIMGDCDEDAYCSIDDDNLRRFRQHLLAKTWTSSDLFQLARSPDVHSLSRLRDAFFHPLEHEYDLLEVKDMIDRLNLRFVGMDDSELNALFLKAMPDKEPSDLQAWHELEMKMPEIFLGMYDLILERR